MKKVYIFWMFLFFFLISCNQSENQKHTEHNNTKTIFSTSIDTLSHLLDFSQYRPVKVKFKYTYIDNSGQNQRISVPGPSDYVLEALLYYDTRTMNKIMKSPIEKTNLPNYTKREFLFDWLPTEVKNELKKSPSNPYGNIIYPFRKQKTGKSWFLKDKILIRKQSF